jgi:glucose-1-phosphate thymidylyltransferase
MKLIILLAGYGTRMRPHTWSRPKPILRVAGNTVVGHILDLMEPLTSDEVIFVVGYKGDQIEQWIRENYGHLNTHFVVQEEALGQAHAVWLCRDLLGEDEVVVAFGDGIVSADYNAFANLAPEVDGVFLVREVEDPRRFGVVVTDDNGYIRQFVEKPEGFEHRRVIVGVNWFRSGRQLRQALDTVMAENRQTLGEYFMVDAYEVMLEQGARFITQSAAEWEDAGKPEAILQTNARLLALGYGTEDALERSYAEGFTVVPPVYIHPTANIEASVIGPYATIEAEVTVRNAIVRNSIIDPGAHVEACILDNALVGERAHVKGEGRELFVGDDSVVTV